MTMSELQAKAVAEELADFDLKTIVASPFQRCLETADAVGTCLSPALKGWHIDCKLCEVQCSTVSCAPTQSSPADQCRC